MASTAAFIIAIFSGIIVTLVVSLLPLFLSGEHWKAVEEKARTRRLAEAKMNARLLRFNL